MSVDINSLFGAHDAGSSLSQGSGAEDIAHNGMAAALGTYDDQELLDLWTKIRRECIDTRLVFERQWHRNILYFLNQPSHYARWQRSDLNHTYSLRCEIPRVALRVYNIQQASLKLVGLVH